jgi:hypothetical protein
MDSATVSSSRLPPAAAAATDEAEAVDAALAVEAACAAFGMLLSALEKAIDDMGAPSGSRK